MEHNVKYKCKECGAENEVPKEPPKKEHKNRKEFQPGVVYETGVGHVMGGGTG